MPPIAVTAADPITISLAVFSILAATSYFTTLGYFAHRHRRTERALASLEARVQEHTATMNTEQERLNTVQADLRVRSCSLNNLGNLVTTLGVDVDHLNTELGELQDELA